MDSAVAVVACDKKGPKAPKPVSIPVVYPPTQADRNNLRRILGRMRLESLYLVGWALKEESFLDFHLDKSNSSQLAGPVRGQTDRWDLECIANSFQLPLDGGGLVSRRTDVVSKYFSGRRDVGHGWKLNQCTVAEVKMVFRFLLPIMHPRKPSYVPLGLGNTIIKAWKERALINWAPVLVEVIRSEVEQLERGGPCYLPGYLGQIYAYHDCLLSNEKSARHRLRRFVKEQYGRDEDVLSEAAEDEAKEDVQKGGNNISEKKGAWALVALSGEGKGPGEENLEAEGVEKYEALHTLMGTVDEEHKMMRCRKRLRRKCNNAVSDDEQDEAQSILERPSNEESMPEDSRNGKLVRCVEIVKRLEEMLEVPSDSLYDHVSLLIMEVLRLRGEHEEKVIEAAFNAEQMAEKMDADPKGDEQALVAVAPRNAQPMDANALNDGKALGHVAPRNRQEVQEQMHVEQGNEEQVQEQMDVEQGNEEQVQGQDVEPRNGGEVLNAPSAAGSLTSSIVDAEYASVDCVFIVKKLKEMLKVPSPQDIMSEVEHLVFVMRLRVEDEEMVPLAGEHGLEVANLRKRAGEFRNYAAELERDADNKVDGIVGRLIDEQGNQRLPQEELDRDVEEEKKLKLYHESILKTTRENWGEASIEPHPRCGPHQRDMAVQCLVNCTILQENLPFPQNKTAQLQVFLDHCEALRKNEQPIKSFWRYYYQKKLNVQYILGEIYNYPSSKVSYTVQNICEIWDRRSMKPIISFMIVFGDLQMQESQQIMAHLGNLPAYCVEFATEFLEQLEDEIDPRGEIYSPQDCKQGVFDTHETANTQQMWDLVPSETITSFSFEFNRVVAKASKAFDAAMHGVDWDDHYGYLMGNYEMYFHRSDLLCMYREADRVDQVFRKAQLPMLYLHRQRRCVPLTDIFKDPTLARDIENKKIQHATLLEEPELVVKVDKSSECI